MTDEEPPHWLSVAVRQGLVLREGTPNTDFRCLEVTHHVWNAIQAETRHVEKENVAAAQRFWDEAYAEYQRFYDRQRSSSNHDDSEGEAHAG